MASTNIKGLSSEIYYTDASSSSDCWAEPYNTSKELLFEIAPKETMKFRTKLAENFSKIAKELQLANREISTAFFIKHKSDLEKDLSKSFPYYAHVIHPIKTEPQYGQANLFSYDLAVISDVLEYMPSTMARANIIKEALTSLKQEKTSYLIITAIPEEDVEKFKDIVSALSEDDLISLASYAGADKIQKLNCMKEAKFPYIIASKGG